MYRDSCPPLNAMGGWVIHYSHSGKLTGSSFQFPILWRASHFQISALVRQLVIWNLDAISTTGVSYERQNSSSFNPISIASPSMIPCTYASPTSSNPFSETLLKTYGAIAPKMTHTISPGTVNSGAIPI